MKIPKVDIIFVAFFVLLIVAIIAVTLLQKKLTPVKRKKTNVEDLLILPEHQFFCDKLNFSFQRCYNDEVICYKYVGRGRGGLTCRWKRPYAN